MKAHLWCIAFVACSSKPSSELPPSPFGVVTPMRALALQARCVGDYRIQKGLLSHHMFCTDPDRYDLGWSVEVFDGDQGKVDGRIGSVDLTAASPEGVRVLAERLIPNLVPIEEASVLFATVTLPSTGSSTVTLDGVTIEVEAEVRKNPPYCSLTWRPNVRLVND